MSIYDNRDTSAYRNLRDFHVESYHHQNSHILKWWTPSHDGLLSKLIERKQWYWAICEIVNEILAITSPDIIEDWKAEDPTITVELDISRPACYWRNVLHKFAVSRAQTLGLTKAIREPKWKVCPLCGQEFVEDSLPLPLAVRLGDADQFDFCAPCLSDTLFQDSGDETLSRQEVLTFLRDLTEVLQRVPPQSFGERVGDLHSLSTEERLAILRVLKRKPTVGRVKKLFGSWFKALIEAGILENDAQKTGRGIRCLAKDGHVCFSLGEKTLDDFLYARGIPHEKEPHYPEGNFRADFAVNGVFIEYFGLKGNPDYDAKTSRKQKICRKHGIRLISVYPSDLVNWRRLDTKLLKGLQTVSASKMSNLLRQGIAALKEGDKLQARHLLSQAIQRDPQNEQAWLWLSGAVESDKERLFCIDRVLEINPNNQAAKRGRTVLLQQ